jgi:hypothetical protein
LAHLILEQLGSKEWRNTMDAGMVCKEVNGAQWTWCVFHNCYCKHTSEECNGNPKNGGHKIVDQDNKHVPTPPYQNVAGTPLTAAMANVGIEDVMEEDEE